MTKTTLIAALLAVLATEASAQSRTFYDSAGRVVGRASTDSQGTTTNYDARGKVISRETTNGSGTTTVYDAGGRNVGRARSDDDDPAKDHLRRDAREWLPRRADLLPRSPLPRAARLHGSAREGHMKGLVRAILFGGGWFIALLAIYFLVVIPETAQLTDREPIFIGVSAMGSALVLWTATRLPATPSWPIAIVGWIVGFFLPLGADRVLLAIADQMFR